ncbi:hypothetical protein EVAR_92461_1 [Eumeta japonica]|uniref:Uncharacterized protein n=1 Tax=Eumeta variegata TaxID=151549 RepID=A0A4C1T9E9_EUMVA|nr:hypothetical protein EVAR_92461_1 [Eumeta japonica]
MAGALMLQAVLVRESRTPVRPGAHGLPIMGFASFLFARGICPTVPYSLYTVHSRLRAMRKRLCDFLLTQFDGAVYYGIPFDYIYHCIAWRPVVTASVATPTLQFTLRL